MRVLLLVSPEYGVFSRGLHSTYALKLFSVDAFISSTSCFCFSQKSPSPFDDNSPRPGDATTVRSARRQGRGANANVSRGIRIAAIVTIASSARGRFIMNSVSTGLVLLLALPVGTGYQLLATNRNEPVVHQIENRTQRQYTHILYPVSAVSSLPNYPIQCTH